MKMVAYCRVSTDKTQQLDSLEHQKSFFTEYAVKHGYDLVRLYADEGITGTSLRKREEFKRLLADAELGLFDMVVVKDISRFARNTVDFLQSIRKLKSLGINTLFLTANMESLGESEFVLTLMSALAQEESVNLSKRVKFGKRINAERGRVPPRIYGYNRVDNFTLKINEEEADTVRRIFYLYNECGYGSRTISAKLNEEGRLTKFGGYWDATGIKRILSNSIYCGEYINGRYEIRDCLEGKQVKTAEENHIYHSRPEWAIVSTEIFSKAQRILESRRKQYENNNPGGRHSNRYAFSTMIKCEHCGRSYARKANQRHPVWCCSTNDRYTSQRCDNRVRIREDKLLCTLKEYLHGLINDKEKFINDILNDLLRQTKSEDEKVDEEAINRKIKTLLGKREKYKEMYLADIINISDLKDKTAAIDAELEKLNYSLEFSRATTNRPKDRDFAEEYRKEIECFLELENINNQDVRKIIDHISVNKNGEITIHLKKYEK